ncbi:hypothetical protein M769_0119945 [Bacillus haynesii]|nr:hypothetical protein M769_0119945 [Bacillus haynesii]
MDKYKFKEKEYVEAIIENGFISKNLNYELKLLAMYYKELGYKPKKREELLYDFCKKNIENFSRVLYFKKINSVLNYARKKENILININEIGVTENELRFIDSLDADLHQKKICFTLLVLSKLHSTVHYIKYGEHITEYYYGGNSKRYKELIDTSHTSLTVNKLHQNIGELAKKDIVEIRNKGFIKLNFIYSIVPGGSAALKIRSFDSIGLYYDLHTNHKKVKQCVNCSTPFRFKSNKSKYCPPCASIIAKEKTRARVRKHRNVTL